MKLNQVKELVNGQYWSGQHLRHIESDSKCSITVSGVGFGDQRKKNFP